MTPQITLKALDGSDITLRLSFMLSPMGHCFMIEELRGGNWIGGPSTEPWFSQDLFPKIDEMNSMGLKAFIEKYVCPWVKTIMKTVYGDRVKAPSGPVVRPATVTPENVVAQVNAALAGFVLQDRDGDGLPELYPT